MRTTDFMGLRTLILASLLFATTSLTFSAPSPTYQVCGIIPPKPAREFRAAWIATVGNIDWPSTNTLSTAEQKAELVAILNKASQLKLNAVILQVRPGCDAIYASSIEPWSEYLTGTMGKAPKPYYDPLAFAIEEAHRRGLELHAWFNPYRARHHTGKSPVAPNHISRKRPELVRPYGKLLWLDPGHKEVQDYSLRVVMDVVSRYDIDAVHFDDYFYPYRERDAAGRGLEFPDERSWQRFGAQGTLSRDDWRRENVNAFVQRVHGAIHQKKPWVKFGVSPFGIWRPGNPQPIRGLDAYEELFADARKWLRNGWLDYCAPQLYWSIASPQTSFPVLLKWWSEQNVMQRHLWPGLNSANVGPQGWKPEEVMNEILCLRKEPGASGHIHWNMSRGLMRNNGLPEALARDLYAQPALVPTSPWLGSGRLGKPKLTLSCAAARTAANWKSEGSGKPWLWLLQTRANGRWTTEILPGPTNSRQWTGKEPDVIALTAVDRLGNLGACATYELRK